MPRSPTGFDGFNNGHITTSATISCPGQPAETMVTEVKLANCNYVGFDVGFQLNDAGVLCQTIGSYGNPTLTLAPAICSGGVRLTSATFVPAAVVSDAYESYLHGSVVQDGESCELELSGPLYAEQYCTELSDGGG